MKERRKRDILALAGQRFGEMGQVEIVRRTDKVVGDRAWIYLIKCHKCASDPELFGEALFEKTLPSIKAGAFGCGCSKHLLWTREQYVVRIRRKCVELGLDFLGVSGEWGNQLTQTRLVLRCEKHDHTWGATSIMNLLTGHGCKHCVTRTVVNHWRKPESEYVEFFLSTGAYPEGTTFRKIPDTEDAWEVHCPLCAGDEFSEARVGSTVFQSTTTALRLGQLPCRCAKQRSWTEEETIFKVKRKLLEQGGTSEFSGWEGGYRNSRSEAQFFCSTHKSAWKANLMNFLGKGRDCPHCSGAWYNRTKEGYFYVLKALRNDEEFVGYGITNNYKVRLDTHKRTLKRNGYEVSCTKIFKACGDLVLDVENKVRYNFPVVNQNVSGFIKEATHAFEYERLIDFARTFLTEVPHPR